MRTAPSHVHRPRLQVRRRRRLPPGISSPSRRNARVIGWLPAAAAALALATAELQAAYTSSPPVSNQTTGWTSVPGTMQDVLLVLGIGIFLLLALLMWAGFFRRKRHHESEPHSTPHLAEDAESGGRRRHRKKRRRRDHRTRNPTLAETGGLPPPRPEGGSTA